jgi:hypothetical protein
VPFNFCFFWFFEHVYLFLNPILSQIPGPVKLEPSHANGRAHPLEGLGPYGQAMFNTTTIRQFHSYLPAA